MFSLLEIDNNLLKLRGCLGTWSIIILIEELPAPHHTHTHLIKNENLWVCVGRVTEEERETRWGGDGKSHCIQCLFSLWVVVKNDLYNHLDSEDFQCQGTVFFITSVFCWPFLGLLCFHQAIGILSESIAGRRSLSWIRNTVYSTWDQRWRIIVV